MPTHTNRDDKLVSDQPGDSPQVEEGHGTMPLLGTQLDLDRCPHCSVDRPSLVHATEVVTADYQNSIRRVWRIYRCTRCGGVVTASAANPDQPVVEWYPRSPDVDDALPERAREYLRQALNSMHTPAGAVMLAASAVDAMLKAKGYKDGSFYARIDKATEAHLITREMAQWAHEVRLDANEQRHADMTAPLPTPEEARRILDFALALGQFLYVLPARVQQGLQQAKPE